MTEKPDEDRDGRDRHGDRRRAAVDRRRVELTQRRVQLQHEMEAIRAELIRIQEQWDALDVEEAILRERRDSARPGRRPGDVPLDQ